MNLFDLFVRVGVKDEATEQIGGIKATTIAAGQLMADGIKVAGRAVASFSKQAIAGYAEYEQLSGGVETLFGKSADTVMKYAEQAYKTAGLSANEYMSTVTSFSASLLQSLGGNTEEAAELADQAIRDMSDNANKMGTDMNAIQNAYNGFAKQNFTMLDNLKLGYGGTQEEMKRLLADAEKLSGQQFDISSYADIVEAVHVVQTEMGITGTTAAEAEKTISGSAAAMKSAWQNLVTGLADENANVDVLLDQFLKSVETTAGNVLPVVGRVLKSIFQTLSDNGPQIVAAGTKLLAQLAVGAVKAIPSIIKSIPEIIEAIVDGFKASEVDVVQIGKDIVRGIWEGISSLAGWIGEKVSGFFDGLFDDVKEHEGIHSPAKKWEFIGKNDALGVGKGWADALPGVRDKVMSGLDFGTSTVDFASSGIGRSSAGIINSVANIPAQNAGGATVNLMLPDGTVLARYYLKSFISEAAANGTPIANPV